MKIRRFFGKDMREALNQVKEELGPDAVIMSTRKRDDGIELVAAYDKEPVAAPKPAPSVSPAAVKPTPTLSEIIGDSGPESLRELLEKQGQSSEQMIQANQQTQQRQEPVFQEPQVSPPRHYQTAESAPVQAEHRESLPAQLDDMKSELASLRNVLSFQVAALGQQQTQLKNPLHSYLLHQLEEMGIESGLGRDLVNYLPADYDERESWLALLKLMANRLHIDGQNLLSQTGVVALVGPTGTGKTTTVAKLAARYAQKYGAEHVAMVTIDTYRIAAYEQLATYGKIIGCSVKKAQTSEELAEVLHQLRNKRLILVDTAGFSQRDARLIGQLKNFQRHANKPMRHYLVAQASAQYASLKGVVEAYKNVSLSGCIFTKIDECYSLGEMISIAINYNLPLSFVTDGQKVPEDISAASAKKLISLAARLYKKYKLHHTSENIAANASRAV